ncbi:MAG TPA: hypothetical protein VIW67_19830 [Terriglobales bacterium]|jgi:outer membrane protein assembly factor BamD (BamD/ComL family)
MKNPLTCRVFVVLCATVILASCSNPEHDFLEAEKINSEQGYQDFIKGHPGSALLGQAQADLEKVVYEATKRAGTSAGFDSFLNRFPNSPLAKRAQADMEGAEYEHAEGTGTVSAYEVFLKRFPTGEHASKAKAELEGFEFVAAAKQGSITGWQSFLQKHPQSVRSTIAASNLCELSFSRAAEQNTIEALEAFLREFPGSMRNRDTLEKLGALAWKDVSASNSVPVYELFLSRFAGTTFAGQATNALARLEYQIALKENTIASYESFLRRFPNSDLANDAKRRLEPQTEDRDWNQTLLENNPPAYLKFWKLHSSGSHIKVIKGTLVAYMVFKNGTTGHGSTLEPPSDWPDSGGPFGSMRVSNIGYGVDELSGLEGSMSVTEASRLGLVSVQTSGAGVGFRKITTSEPLKDVLFLYVEKAGTKTIVAFEKLSEIDPALLSKSTIGSGSQPIIPQQTVGSGTKIFINYVDLSSDKGGKLKRALEGELEVMGFTVERTDRPGQFVLGGVFKANSDNVSRKDYEFLYGVGAPDETGSRTSGIFPSPPKDHETEFLSFGEGEEPITQSAKRIVKNVLLAITNYQQRAEHKKREQ